MKRGVTKKDIFIRFLTAIVNRVTQSGNFEPLYFVHPVDGPVPAPGSGGLTD